MWTDDFLALMSGETVTPAQIERAMALKDRNLPEKIYKFRKIDKDDYALSNFRDDTVWLCSTDKYNDPYECSVKVGFDCLLVESMKRVLPERAKDASKLNLSDREIADVLSADDPVRALSLTVLGKDKRHPPDKIDAVAAAFSNALKANGPTLMAAFTAKIQKGMKVCSFSTRNDSLLMWGHYAESHTGFCLEYDVKSWPGADNRRRALYPVLYVKAIFDSTKYIAKSMEGGAFNNLFGVIAAITKARDWAYESEWRFVLPLGASEADRNYAIPPASAVYIGARASPSNVKELGAIARAKGIPAFRMGLSATEFKMAPEPIV